MSKKKDKPISPIWFHGMRLLLVHPDTYGELNMRSYGGIHDATVLDIAELASELIKNTKTGK